MRYEQIPNSLFIKNRKNFVSKMKPNTIAILTSNDVKHNNADDVMGFTQNNDLFYLSGIDQEDSILVLYPDAYKKNNKAILFVKETNEHIKIWDGEKLTKEQATAISGIERVEWLQDFETLLQYMAFEADTFYLGHNEHKKTLTAEMNTQQDRMISWCKKRYPLHDYKRAAKITREIRQIKSEEEIGLMQKAADISVGSFKRVLKAVKPGMLEYELEAELTFELLKNGAKRHAFMPIVASGKNACALHYNTNDAICEDGDMVLMDFGVCYANYNSDTTRCFPVNGKFTDEQKAIYQIVLDAQEAAIKVATVGHHWNEPHEVSVTVITQGLLDLGLLSGELETLISEMAYKRFYMHRIGHWLGMDVHDVGDYKIEGEWRALEPNMVMTVEPGIYISPDDETVAKKWRGIGVRIEDDVLITKGGNDVLSKDVPKTIADIEALMAR